MATKVSIKFEAQIQSALNGIGQVHAAMSKLTKNATSFGKGLTNFGQKMTRNVTLPIAAGLGVATKEAVTFEKSLINASRALDFSEKQVNDFSKAAREIAVPLGILPKTFVDIATESGKLGISANEILGYSRNIAELSAATDTNAVRLTQQIAGIKTVFNLTNDEVRSLGASVNFLDDAIGGSTSGILNFLNRTAGNANLLGFAAENVAAIGSVMQKLNLGAEEASRAVNNLFVNLASDAILSKRQVRGLEMLGLTAEGITTLMKESPQKGLLTFLEAVNNLNTQGGDALGAVTLFTGRDFAPKILKLAQSYQELNRAFAIAGDEQGALNKLQAETEKRLNSSSGRISIFRAQMSNLGITLGTAVLPALNSILKSISPLIQSFAVWAETNPELLKMGLIIAGLVAVIAPLLVGIGSVITAVGAIAPVVAVVVKIIGLVIAAIGALVGSPIALILGAIAAVVASGWWLVNNWEMVGSYLGNLWVGIQNGASNLWQAFINDPVAQAAVRLWNNAASGIVNSLVWVGDSIKWLIHRFYELPNQANQATNYLLQVFNNFFTKTIPNLFSQVGNWFMDAGKYLMLTFARGIQSKINEALRPIIDFTNKVRAYLPSSDAKVGALSTLTEAGRALLDTVAMGINDRNLVNAVALGSQNTRDAIAFGGVQPTPNTAGNTVTFNFSPNINVGNNADAQNIVEQLEPYARELLELIERSQNRINRGSF